MTLGRKHQKWETRPFECWSKAKELRRKHSQEVIGARAKRNWILEGSETILWGFANIRPVIGPPQVAITAAANSKLNREAQAAAECRGFGRVLCGYRRGFYGVQLLDKDLSGGKFPGRDFCFAAPAPCDDHAKDIGPTADFFHIPRWQREAPRYIGPLDRKRQARMCEHIVAHTMEAIEWVEKTTGQEFDEEAFIETAKIEFKFHTLAGQALCLNQNIPAPLDMKSLYSFYTLGFLVRSGWKETEEFWKALRDELQWRVDNHIAAVPNERFRFIEHEPPPWHYLQYLRYLETYGAVGLGSLYCFGIGGPYEVQADGGWVPKKNPIDLGWPLKTVEDVIRAEVKFSQNAGPPDAANTDAFPGRYGIAKTAVSEVVSLAKAFHADGAILPLHLDGVGCVWAMREISLGVEEQGLSVLRYECSQPGDRRDLDENRMLDEIDVWMESHGLERMEQD
jgi:benzoyl-CoA reductase subunit B